MNQLIDATKTKKPLPSKRYLNQSVVILTLALLGWTSCKNADKTPATNSSVTTEQTASAPANIPVANGQNADQLKTAQAPQSPLHKLLDSLNKAGQPQWKLTFLDSVARKNPKVTMPQLKHVFDSLGKVKRGFIKK